MYRKIVSAALSAALLLGAAVSPGLAAPEAQKGERVRIVVETEGEPLLQTEGALRLGAAEFMRTAEAEEAERRLETAQDGVKADIERLVGEDANSGFTYTSVINGFSMEAYVSDIEKIKSVDGVKNVYIAPTVKAPSAGEARIQAADGELSTGARMINAHAMYEAGYDGRGQVIAVIDTGFDTAHEFFASPVEEPRLSKREIDDIIKNNSLNANVEVNQVYKNEKIPFAYDYAEQDADTYDPDEHGSHVAGIAAGKNGVYGDMTFSGVAPEAQLVLMKIFYSNKTFSFDTAIAAMDDASKMGVDVVNMSAGGIYAEIPLCEKAVNNLRNAGIAIIGTAGNSDRGNETADNPDYVYYDLPSSYSASTSVASIDSDEEWDLGGRITLGSGENLDLTVYSKPFFEKFSDKFYEYEYVETRRDLAFLDLDGKIAVIPNNFKEISTRELFARGVLGIVVISDGEADGDVATATEEVPGVVVRRSFGDEMLNAEEQTLKTSASQVALRDEIPEAGMSEFTSWGTGGSLELKPEITAPGGYILSAVQNGGFETMSGTSMATPQISGATALLNAYVRDKYPDVKGPEKVTLMEDLLMSSASIVFQDEGETMPESPRLQGAGLADLAAAIKIPVILRGDGGKSKLSLKDRLTDEISISFTAENLTNSDVVYDDVKLYVFTDDYNEEGGKNLIADSTPLDFTSDAPKSVTVPAGGKKEISFKIKLNDEQTKDNLEVFTNGFWVDGFVVLSTKDGSIVKSSIPFTGFYGDWTAFDAMTPTYFEAGGSAENGGMTLREPGNIYTLLGTNKFARNEDNKSEYESADYVGLSSRKAGSYFLRLRMTRSLIDVTVTDRDFEGDVVNDGIWKNGLTRQNEDNNYFENIPLVEANLPEGDYTLTVKGRIPYDGAGDGVKQKTLKFYVDSTPPEISNPRIYTENGRKYAAFGVSDNRYIMGAEASDALGGYIYTPVKAEKNTEIVLDITGMDEASLDFTVLDYAYNETGFRIGAVRTDIVVSDKVGGDVAFIANINNTAAEIDADVVMALYSKDGGLVGAQKQNVRIAGGEKRIIAFNFSDAGAAVEAKLFVWKHGEMTPICEPVMVTEL